MLQMAAVVAEPHSGMQESMSVRCHIASFCAVRTSRSVTSWALSSGQGRLPAREAMAEDLMQEKEQQEP